MLTIPGPGSSTCLFLRSELELLVSGLLNGKRGTMNEERDMEYEVLVLGLACLIMIRGVQDCLLEGGVVHLTAVIHLTERRLFFG